MYTFTPLDTENYQVIQGLFTDTNDWVEAPNEAWRDYILSSNSANAFIVQLDETPLGFIQCEKGEEDVCALALYLNINHRGQGHGPKVLQEFIDFDTACREFTAFIEQDNLLSSSVFLRAGFQEMGPSKQPGMNEFRYVRN